MKRRMPPHIVLPNGMWRFTKRGGGSPHRKGKVMARRGRRRSAGRSYYFSRRRGGGGGGGRNWKGMIAPIVGGAADAIINPRSPINGIGSSASGFLLKDDVTMKIGLYQIGQSIAAFIPFLGASAGGVANQV